MLNYVLLVPYGVAVIAFQYSEEILQFLFEDYRINDETKIFKILIFALLIVQPYFEMIILRAIKLNKIKELIMVETMMVVLFIIECATLKGQQQIINPVFLTLVNATTKGFIYLVLYIMSFTITHMKRQKQYIEVT
uniref:Transmembrane domain-containing protein n=1 Tax=Spironucleus salmonicida TaxID=348837 RepID=V6LM16_9EUKA|eukprot:EST41749.1 Transmembrane domain-containing protein [Spironucleus salmonicida]